MSGKLGYNRFIAEIGVLWAGMLIWFTYIDYPRGFAPIVVHAEGDKRESSALRDSGVVWYYLPILTPRAAFWRS